MRRVALVTILVLGFAGVASAEGAGAYTDVARAALEGAVVVPGARVEVSRLVANVPPSCRIDRAATDLPIEGSGRVTLRLEGRAGLRPCAGSATATVRVLAALPVTTRGVRVGDALDGSFELVERELRAGRAPASIAPGAVATRALGKGQVIEPTDVRELGPSPGETIKVRVVIGAVAVEQVGRVVPCGRGKSCAVVPSGKRVEGRFVEGRLWVELP